MKLLAPIIVLALLIFIGFAINADMDNSMRKHSTELNRLLIENMDYKHKLNHQEVIRKEKDKIIDELMLENKEMKRWYEEHRKRQDEGC